MVASCGSVYIDFEASIGDHEINCTSLMANGVVIVYHGPRVKHTIWLLLSELHNNPLTKLVSFGG